MGANIQQIAFGAVVAAMLVAGAYTGSQGTITLGGNGPVVAVSVPSAWRSACVRLTFAVREAAETAMAARAAASKQIAKQIEGDKP